MSNLILKGDSLTIETPSAQWSGDASQPDDILTLKTLENLTLFSKKILDPTLSPQTGVSIISNRTALFPTFIRISLTAQFSQDVVTSPGYRICSINCNPYTITIGDGTIIALDYNGAPTQLGIVRPVFSGDDLIFRVQPYPDDTQFKTDTQFTIDTSIPIILRNS